MKILVATDGSTCSGAAVREVAGRQWPAGSEVEVLHIVHTNFPFIPDPTLVLAAEYATLLHEASALAPKIVEAAAAEIRAAQPGLHVTSKVVDGGGVGVSPKHVIVEEAEAWGADLIVLGAHGFGPVKRFLLGSVSHAVALHAPCSVEIVRSDACREKRAG